jgi:RNA polymerase sigma-70 factor (ECF subfamily)
MGDMKNNKDIQATFETLFQEYSDVIYRFCLFKTSSEDVAHDLTQETFLRLWKSMSAGKEIKKSKQYIYQIARNLIVDYYKRHKAVSLDLLQQDGYEPKSKAASSELLSEVSLLKEVIESLDEEFREVIYMRFVEEMKVKDIAELLGISVSLTSVRIHRGKAMLKKKFE